MTNKTKSVAAIPLFAGALLLAGVCGVSGCEQKEKVFELDAPGVEVDVEKSKRDGAVDVDVDG
ncbi:hypothetical protein Pla175_50430 [Pirellulimonas nuda]|uniref:Secreted protein n=1 Tax=Pirellulimonas nuda TaxID=2528009 RepID=A0A518DJG4_9BACT|nr:hypothetical protein [Pirellulimonas nuda]QDU91613.1 hypothetical protein Pla175_50430 [Pirellulimonas nuda]